MLIQSDIMASEKQIWVDILDNRLAEIDAVDYLLKKEINPDHCSWLFPDIKDSSIICSKKIVDIISDVKINEIIDKIASSNYEEITSNVYPWVYSLEDALFVDLHLLSFNSLTNEELGFHSPYCKLKTRTNTQRFGQSHSSFLRLLGLVKHECGADHITSLGLVVDDLAPSYRLNVVTKLYFSIPLIRNLYREDSLDLNNIFKYTSATMKESVIKRRLPSVRKMVDEIEYLRRLDG